MRNQALRHSGQRCAAPGYDTVRTREITGKARREYRRILRGLPEFEKSDRFKMNIVSCAMPGAFLL